MEALQIQQAKMPFTHAHVCLITGEQGSGKSVTGVARIRDAYDKDALRLYCTNILKLDNFIVKSYDRKNRKGIIKQDGVLKLVTVANGYKLYSPIKIYSNLHLYGIPYIYCKSFKQIAEWLKGNKIVRGYLLIDEYYIGGNAREHMKSITIAMEKQSFQFRKMGLEVIVIAPLDRLADWTMRAIVTERIVCRRDDVTGKTILTIRKKGVRGEKEVTYDPAPYYGNYDTNERITE